MNRIRRFCTLRSYLDCENDYELVIKATKHIENRLVREFNADGMVSFTKKVSSQINTANVHGKPLPEGIKRKLRSVVDIRNKLVHNLTCEKLENRNEFLTAFSEIQSELSKLRIQKNNQNSRFRF